MLDAQAVHRIDHFGKTHGQAQARGGDIIGMNQPVEQTDILVVFLVVVLRRPLLVAALLQREGAIVELRDQRVVLGSR